MGDWPLIAAAAILGLLCGSFANVLIARIPSGADWVRGASRCPACGHEIGWHDNIPVLSWLWLRRRCRHCRARISARYPTVEIAVAVLFALTAGAHGLSVIGGTLALLAITTVALAAIDLEHMRLPDALVMPSAAIAAAGVTLAGLLAGDGWSVVRALLGALILGGVYFVLWFAAPRGLGFGDVKLAVPLGLVLGHLGWGVLAVGAILGPIIGMLAAIAGMVRARAWRGVRIPYGPWMIAAFWVAALWGDTIAQGYVSWVLGGA